jgi:hypothetical protein
MIRLFAELSGHYHEKGAAGLRRLEKKTLAG